MLTKSFGKNRQISAVEAKSNAQKIAFAPVVYQATRALRDLGILELLSRSSDRGRVPGCSQQQKLEAGLEYRVNKPDQAIARLDARAAYG